MTRPACWRAQRRPRRAVDANPFAAPGSAAPGPIPGMDLLTGSPAPGSRENDADPLGALDPLGAGAPVRVKKEPAGVFGAAAARRSKKSE